MTFAPHPACDADGRPGPSRARGGSGRSDDPLLGPLTQQLTKDQFPVLLEYAKASFERIEH